MFNENGREREKECNSEERELWEGKKNTIGKREQIWWRWCISSAQCHVTHFPSLRTPCLVTSSPPSPPRTVELSSPWRYILLPRESSPRIPPFVPTKLSI